MKKLNPWIRINNGGDDSKRASIIRTLLGFGKLSGKLDLWKRENSYLQGPV